ncbi:uncharacterized protein BT62DRAFT_963722 [Guyanagaster necrorhizus]|uniref:Uncharacterized protein n=1 Tax=Guyanagaster necrorhizus TaxID=856835 RepID=A0A9P7VYK5_9AGAR|nr:uncharacterized protein BT62DRAFT_963722 [Guyanagaster necrorhizus MCA 3950]KAG7448958.1 hypothetical protein BT62DRAFT_963722 [Guyanagaster necrorhizus MCA 3950]
MSTDLDNDTDPVEKKRQIHLSIPPRLLVLPPAFFIAGSLIGFIRGTRSASLRFLAENAHRPPRTLQGWYFYNKTKNYKVLLAGSIGAVKEGAKLAVVGAGWAGIEEGFETKGWPGKEIAAGTGTAAVISALYRLGWQTSGRTVALGATMGGVMQALLAGRKYVEEHQKLETEGDAPSVK